MEGSMADHPQDPVSPMHGSSSTVRGGHIQLVLGPMFSGKSSELMRRCRRHLHASKAVLLIKFAGDTRYSNDKMSSHDKVQIAAVSARQLSEVSEHAIDRAEVIGIDEGQFFPDVAEAAERWAQAGKTVIIAGLDGDFRRQRFGGLVDLVPQAESVVKLSAICKACGSDAAFTMRLTSDEAVELIGGAEMYVPVCRGCHGDADRVRRAVSMGDRRGIELAKELELAAGALHCGGGAGPAAVLGVGCPGAGDEECDECEEGGENSTSPVEGGTGAGSGATVGGSVSRGAGSAAEAALSTAAGAFEDRRNGSAAEQAAPRTPAPPTLPLTPGVGARSEHRRRRAADGIQLRGAGSADGSEDEDLLQAEEEAAAADAAAAAQESSSAALAALRGSTLSGDRTPLADMRQAAATATADPLGSRPTGVTSARGPQAAADVRLAMGLRGRVVATGSRSKRGGVSRSSRVATEGADAFVSKATTRMRLL